MDPLCASTAVLLFIQMVMVLVMLNPSYDLRKITNYIDDKTKKYKIYIAIAIGLYFAIIIYIGVYISLQNIFDLALEDIDETEKEYMLIWTEKNFLMTGFSVFLAVVFYGIKCLVGYTASLMEQSDRQLHLPKPKPLGPNTITNALMMKRSVSYETILYARDLREQLNMLMRNPAFSSYRYKLPNILQATLRAE